MIVFVTIFFPVGCRCQRQHEAKAVKLTHKSAKKSRSITRVSVGRGSICEGRKNRVLFPSRFRYPTVVIGSAMEISKTTIGIAAGVAGTLFLGYCIYFDQKRRKDPDFKKKLRERRKAKKAASAAGGPRSNMPNMADHEEVQRFFLQEIQMGEALISSGDIENGVEHLANAVIVCGQPAQLLQVLQQTLPAQVFTLLINRMRQYGNQSGGGDSEKAKLQDLNDDLE